MRTRDVPDVRTPDVEHGRAVASELTARSGRTYHLASLLLAPERRRAVHALYGFARIVDDVVEGSADGPADGSGPQPAPVAADRVAAVDLLEAGLRAALQAAPVPAGLSADHADLLAALAVSVHDTGVGVDTFDAFLTSMRMDLPGSAQFRNRYRTFDELAEYTYGSAAVIGLQLIPVLGADPSLADGAALLGEAFQLTNFIRDVAEDLRRDRIYLPLDELAAFGVDEESLRTDLRIASTSPELRRALAHLIAVNRAQYRRTAPAIAALPRAARPAIAAAARSYSGILRAVELLDHDVMAGRAVVPTRRRVLDALASTIMTPRFAD